MSGDVDTLREELQGEQEETERLSARVAELETENTRLREPWKVLTGQGQEMLDMADALAQFGGQQAPILAAALRRCMASHARLDLAARDVLQDLPNDDPLYPNCGAVQRMRTLRAALAGKEVNRG
jgi:hypothetical protein